ncbi:MAG: hypothetical protein U9Q99_00430 [Nanoarchaeota archaeon]|nr:hypothetical protein [Nanoarchaeota archaeon]
MKKDIYNHKDKYLSWKEKNGKRIPKISIKNSQIILEYLYDMENGLNIFTTNKKGARGYPRLNNIRQRTVFLVKFFLFFHFFFVLFKNSLHLTPKQILEIIP